LTLPIQLADSRRKLLKKKKEKATQNLKKLEKKEKDRKVLIFNNLFFRNITSSS
jgi:hypothetical protein